MSYPVFGVTPVGSYKEQFTAGGIFAAPVRWLSMVLVGLSAFDDVRNMTFSASGAGRTDPLILASIMGYVIVVVLTVFSFERWAVVFYVLYLLLLLALHLNQGEVASLAVFYVLLGLQVYTVRLKLASVVVVVSIAFCLGWSMPQQVSGQQPLVLVTLVYLMMTTGIALVLRYISTRGAYERQVAEFSRASSLLDAEKWQLREHELRQHTQVMQEELSQELHDAIGHQLTSIVMQANIALFSGQDDAKESLRSISVTAREALGEMRRLVGLMREAPEPGEGIGAVNLSADYDRILEYLRDLGFIVEEEFSGRNRLPLSPDIEKSASMILREAATNVAKHSPPGCRCRIIVHLENDILQIRLSNELGSGTLQLPLSGFGLHGLEQRMRNLGGRFYAEPVGSWWVLNAEIPLS